MTIDVPAEVAFPNCPAVLSTTGMQAAMGKSGPALAGHEHVHALLKIVEIDSCPNSGDHAALAVLPNRPGDGLPRSAGQVRLSLAIPSRPERVTSERSAPNRSRPPRRIGVDLARRACLAVQNVAPMLNFKHPGRAIDPQPGTGIIGRVLDIDGRTQVEKV